MSESRQQIETTADRIRDELLTTLRELDRRRHEATDLKHQVEAHADFLLAVGLGGAALLGIGLGIAAWRRKTRRRYALKRRVEGMLRAWEHPERLASRAKDRPLPSELGRKLVLTFAGAVATRLAKQFAEGLLAAPPRAAGEQEPRAFIH